MKGNEVMDNEDDWRGHISPCTDQPRDVLRDVLRRAHVQAMQGKGRQRHGNERPFDEQPMQRLMELHGLGFATGQASKKSQEAQRMSTERAVHELLGSIVYLAGAIVYLERKEKKEC